MKSMLCPDARINGCPYEFASRENCATCQDLPVWYFDNSNGKETAQKKDV